VNWLNTGGFMFDTFLSIEGIPGEALDSNHKDWIEVLSFSQEMQQPTSSTRGSAGGAATGRTVHGDFKITKFIDKSSPKLYDALSTGKHIKKVKLEVCRAGGSQLKFYEIAFDEVLISRIQISAPEMRGAAAGNDDLLPTEDVWINYGKVEWTYTQQKRPDGSGGGNVTAKFDLTQTKA
jgi:type VI secretion system secreted protein Hcp